MKASFLFSAKKASFTLMAAVGLLLLGSGCAGGVYTSGTVGYYDYDYYPDSDVYFYPQANVFFWNDGHDWRHGRYLPHDFRLREENREHLRLHSHEPWTEHRPENRAFDGHYHGDRR